MGRHGVLHIFYEIWILLVYFREYSSQNNFCNSLFAYIYGRFVGGLPCRYSMHVCDTIWNVVTFHLILCLPCQSFITLMEAYDNIITAYTISTDKIPENVKWCLFEFHNIRDTNIVEFRQTPFM